jgi:hypothetical protein
MAEAVSTVRTSEEESKRCGRRPGAGRKPHYLKWLGIKAIIAAEILAHFSEIDLWRGLLTHKNATIRLQGLQYLTDRRDGRPKQAVEVARCTTKMLSGFLRSLRVWPRQGTEDEFSLV